MSLNSEGEYVGEVVFRIRRVVKRRHLALKSSIWTMISKLERLVKQLGKFESGG